MPTTLLIVAAVAILIILLATASYKVCPADRVMVITGPGGRRFVSGGSAFIIPFIMRVDWLSLGAVQSLLRTDTPIPTKDAILIDVNAVANFQIASETMTVDENGKQVKALENAAKNYLNQSKERMEKDVTQVLLGKLREVIGRTELKTLMENRETFATTVAESARVDMERLGLQLTTFNIQDFTDRQNVIANMGAEMAAEISRNAKLASINAEQDVAVRQNQLDLKRAELQSISDKAQAEADAVKGITAAEQSKTLKVKEQEAEIAAAEKRAVLEQKNAEIEEQKLNATIRKKADADRYAAEQQADAELYLRQQEAQAIQSTADADAHATEVKGKAEGSAAQSKGVGEAEAIRAQGRAYNAMNNTYILAQQYIQILPDMVRAAAEPLTKVDHITMYGDGNSTKLVGDTVNSVSQLSEGLSQSLGIDLKALLNSMVAGHAAGSALGEKVSEQSGN
ncbi:SPFH domain-containing protein [Bifidobacterium adolescentis]|uniref:SPFH domain-containing protein n=1 Tax=Bifidobacterium adolescentis TaxID=1680 RepID=A0AAW5JZX8_BIFAD|nr:flotillin family protein [Bifidobacterium adolescentis]MCQ4793668.1 SPFH domain-containing protein [Bifidobacterium adolescentis]